MFMKYLCNDSLNGRYAKSKFKSVKVKGRSAKSKKVQISNLPQMLIGRVYTRLLSTTVERKRGSLLWHKDYVA